jgi:hypothetical protein
MELTINIFCEKRGKAKYFYENLCRNFAFSSAAVAEIPESQLKHWYITLTDAVDIDFGSKLLEDLKFKKCCIVLNYELGNGRTR